MNLSSSPNFCTAKDHVQSYLGLQAYTRTLSRYQPRTVPKQKSVLISNRNRTVPPAFAYPERSTIDVPHEPLKDAPSTPVKAGCSERTLSVYGNGKIAEL
jgi:hypothetical protein